MAKRGPNKNSPARCMEASRRAEAIRLRAQGYDLDVIASKMGVDRSTVGKLVRRQLNVLAEDGLENAEEVRRLELTRLDEMLVKLEPALGRGDVKAIETALKIMDRRAKYLGLDQDPKMASQTVNFVNMTVEQLVAEAGRLGLEIPQTLLLGHQSTGGEGRENEATDPEEGPGGLQEDRV